MHLERTVVVQTLMGMGFFAWGLDSRSPLSSAYARRQIDDCDYVLLLLGSQYGEQSVSGISYMHLEYIYAVTKQKPIIVLMQQYPQSIHAEADPQELQRQEKFMTFRCQLQKEVEQVVMYQSTRDLELAIRSHLPQMTVRYPSLGWVRPQNLQILQDEIDHLKVKLAQARLQQHATQSDPFLSLPRVSIEDVFSFDYRMHAYQDDGFKEIITLKHSKWAELLSVLSAEFEHPTPEAFFSKVLNDFLNRTGLRDAQKKMPRAHAIGRVQINIRALDTIKQQMRQNEWIVPVGRDDRQRMLWKVTDKGLKLLEELRFFGHHMSIIE